MKLSKRESKLLKVLFIIAIAIVYINYMMLPGIEKYKETKMERQKVEERYKDAMNAVEEEVVLDQQIVDLEEATNVILENYLTTTEQEEIVLLMDDFISSDIRVDRIEFSNFSKIKVGDREIQRQSIDIDYFGTYENVLLFLDRNWNFYKQIALDEIEMLGNGSGDTTGKLSLSYYWVPESEAYEDKMFHWVQNDAYLKSNPFVRSLSVDRDNHIFIGGNADKLEELFNKPFVDVSGHWAEAEIEGFRQSGYVIADDQNNFYPDAPITRGEFIIMLDKIYQWPIPDEDVDLSNFEDYGELGNYEGAIAKAILKGYMGGYVIGYTDNTLRPRDPITYEEIEYIMSKIKKDNNFTWDPIGQRILEERGVRSPGLDDKRQSVSRAEAVFMMYYYQ